jgi:hypothetical protein
MNFNKLFEQEVGEIVVCFIDGLGLVIGRPSGKTEAGDVPSLNKPKLITVNRQTQQTGLGQMLGNPDRIYLTQVPIFVYRVQDKKLIASYIENISGLAIVDKIPSQTQ